MKTQITILLVVLAATFSATAQDDKAKSKRSAEQQVLDRFAGEWKTVVTNKTDGSSVTSFQSRSWSRGGKGVVLHEHGVESPSGSETAGLWQYDSENGVYRVALLFNNSWVIIDGTWDEKSQTMTWNKSIDGFGNRGSGTHRFIDKDHTEWTMVVKNPAGDVVADLSAKQTRLTAAAEKAEKAGLPVPKRSAEQKVLGRFVGEWKEVATNKDEAPSTTMTSRYWSRSGKGTVVHQESVDSSNGSERALIWRYEPESKLYRLAYLVPNGWVIFGGSWDEKSETMTWQDYTNSWGSSGSGTHHFIDENHSEWTFAVTNPAGEVLLDLSAKVSRVEAADKK